jgi:hypothetical protein
VLLILSEMLAVDRVGRKVEVPFDDDGLVPLSAGSAPFSAAFALGIQASSVIPRARAGTMQRSYSMQGAAETIHITIVPYRDRP